MIEKSFIHDAALKSLRNDALDKSFENILSLTCVLDFLYLWFVEQLKLISGAVVCLPWLD